MLDNNKACLSIQITSISNIIIITIITTIHAINIPPSFPVEEENSFFCFYLRRKLNIACPLYLKVKHVINKMYEACTRWDKLFITLYAALLWIWLSKTDMYHSMYVTQFSYRVKTAKMRNYELRLCMYNQSIINLLLSRLSLYPCQHINFISDCIALSLLWNHLW